MKMGAGYETIRIEVKFTTSDSVSVPAREIAALATEGARELGLLGTLFWCGDRELDGRWLLADVDELGRAETRGAAFFSKATMARLHRSQTHLGELKEHLDSEWPRFLQAFYDEATEGHEALVKALANAHERRTTAAKMPTGRVLEIDHREAIQDLIEAHGEQVAGHVFQDLFAYLVGFMGYRRVTINPVGVPDATVSAPRTSSEPEIYLGPLTLSEAGRLRAHCDAAGDVALAERLARLIAAQES